MGRTVHALKKLQLQSDFAKVATCDNPVKAVRLPDDSGDSPAGAAFPDGYGEPAPADPFPSVDIEAVLNRVILEIDAIESSEPLPVETHFVATAPITEHVDTPIPDQRRPRPDPYPPRPVPFGSSSFGSWNSEPAPPPTLHPLPWTGALLKNLARAKAEQVKPPTESSHAHDSAGGEASDSGVPAQTSTTITGELPEDHTIGVDLPVEHAEQPPPSVDSTEHAAQPEADSAWEPQSSCEEMEPLLDPLPTADETNPLQGGMAPRETTPSPYCPVIQPLLDWDDQRPDEEYSTNEQYANEEFEEREYECVERDNKIGQNEHTNADRDGRYDSDRSATEWNADDGLTVEALANVSLADVESDPGQMVASQAGTLPSDRPACSHSPVAVGDAESASVTVELDASTRTGIASGPSEFERDVVERLANPQVAHRFEELAKWLIERCPEPCVIQLIALNSSARAAEVAAFLGITLARRMDEPVLLVDADIRESRLTERYVSEHRPGLLNVLDGTHDLRDVARPTGVAGLHFSSLGTNQTLPQRGLSASNVHLNRWLQACRRDYQFTIVDSGTMNARTTSPMAQVCDGVALVVRLASSRLQDATELSRRLRRAGCPVLGSIVTDEPT